MSKISFSDFIPFGTEKKEEIYLENPLQTNSNCYQMPFTSVIHEFKLEKTELWDQSTQISYDDIIPTTKPKITENTIAKDEKKFDDSNITYQINEILNKNLSISKTLSALEKLNLKDNQTINYILFPISIIKIGCKPTIEEFTKLTTLQSIISYSKKNDMYLILRIPQISRKLIYEAILRHFKTAFKFNNIILLNETKKIFNMHKVIHIRNANLPNYKIENHGHVIIFHNINTIRVDDIEKKIFEYKKALQQKSQAINDHKITVWDSKESAIPTPADISDKGFMIKNEIKIPDRKLETQEYWTKKVCPIIFKLENQLKRENDTKQGSKEAKMQKLN